MGSIVESYDVTSRVILQALLNSFWPGLMVLFFAWVALRTINRSSATTRHAIWVVCLLAIGSLPVPAGTQRRLTRFVINAAIAA
jgi:hypothetical protein